MKKIILLLLAVAICGGCEKGGDGEMKAPKAEETKAKAPLHALSGEPDGFRDIRWGADISGFNDMTPVDEPTENGDGHTVYTRQNENLTLDGIALKKIEYEFEHGKFTRATAILGGDGTGASRLKEALFTAYGPVGPFMVKAPQRLGIETPYREYLWEFRAGSIGLLLNGQGDDNVLLFSAAQNTPIPAGS